MRQGQRRVEQQVQWVKRTDLSFRMHVETAEEIRRPQNGVSAFQCVLIEITQWQVKRGEIVQREHASARQGYQQRDEQKQCGDDHGPGETAIEHLVAHARCLRSFECGQAAPRCQTARIDLPRRWPRRWSMRRETGMHQRSQSVTCATVGDDDRRSTRFPRLNQKSGAVQIPHIDQGCPSGCQGCQAAPIVASVMSDRFVESRIKRLMCGTEDDD